MTPRFQTTLAAVLLLAALASAREANWIRYPAIAPDGRQVVFSYLGDLWLVDAAGGDARPLTTHVGYEFAPIWSPDGRWIAFASDRHGNFDVFLIPADGGEARRLTWHSSNDIPYCFTPDGKAVLFGSRRLDAPDSWIGSAWLPELYSVPVGGGRPVQELTTAAERAQLSPDGKRLAYQDLRGYENRWRKHHVSSVARDVWIQDRATGRHVKLTAFRGEDRNPVWSPDGKTVFYLSERSGSFNVWSRPAEPGGEPRRLTRHGPHPVRFLSIARDGTLCYAYDGGLRLLPPGGEPKRVPVRVRRDARVNARRFETLRKGATEMAVSPGEEEVAFVVRGEVFVASIEHGTTRRLTHTPQQERSLSWAPDGRSLYFAAERGSSWDLYRVSLVEKDEERFFRATRLKEESVLATPDEEFRPVVSPDGKRLAYLFNRDEIRLLDLATKETKTLVPAARNYSYSDGDIRFAWSPDSKWLAFNFLGPKSWNDDVGVTNVETGELKDLTLSGYEEWRPRWSADGTAILFYSNRLGRRAHGSWGSEGDVFALDLTRAAHDRALLSEEEYELTQDEEDKEEEEGAGEGKPKRPRGRRGKRKAKPPPKPVVIEFEGIEERLRRVTLHSADVSSFALSPDGETLVYFAEMDGKWDLWINEIRKKETRKLRALGDPRGGQVEYASDGRAVFVRRSDGRIARVPTGGGGGGGGGPRRRPGGGGGGGDEGGKRVGYAAEMTIDGPAERAYIFEHAWRQVSRKFYDPKLHGVDWPALKEHYAPRLADIDNNHDFAELLSELLGELNASHTGARYRVPQDGADKTAALGLLFDVVRPVDDGLVVAEVLRRGPLDKAVSRVKPGVVLTHIDGAALTPAVNHNRLLNRRAGKRTRLTFRAADGKVFEEVVRPIEFGAEADLRYLRWRRRCREKTNQLSGGRIGYVHLRGMNDRSFRHLYQEALGRHGAKEALIVDTRFNGGGWLHDDLVKFLGGKRYGYFQPRGKELGSMGGEPAQRWARPVVVIQNEANYSDAHVFPYAFKKLAVGKLVGAPVAGTGTAVWWERQIDPTLVFGIPQVGLVTPEGRYLENFELEPDVLVVNDPNARREGRDPQLEKAVETLLAELEGR